MLKFVRKDLIGELLDGRIADPEKEELMETGHDEQRRINENVAMLKATEEALKIVEEISKSSN